MTRGRSHSGTAAASRQLSESGEFLFASWPSSSLSPSGPRTSTASPARLEQPLESAKEPSTPPLLDSEQSESSAAVAEPPEASLESRPRQDQTILEQAIDHHTASDVWLDRAPDVRRWRSYDSASITASERKDEAADSSSHDDGLDGSTSATSASVRYRQLVAPPTPLAVPGGWTGAGGSFRYVGPLQQAAAELESDARGLRWRAVRNAGGKTARRRESVDVTDSERGEALVLPPPFLTTDSPKESFDGLLGTRSARQRSRIARQHERLFAQGRAPPPPFPQNVIKAAVKVARLLGPPAGFDEYGRRFGVAQERHRDRRNEDQATERSTRRKGLSLDQAAQLVERDDPEGRQMERQRRRVKRAESGIKAYEIGARVGRHLAGRLERHRSRRDETPGTDDVAMPDAMAADRATNPLRPDVAVTPAHLLGSPPSPVPRNFAGGDQSSERSLEDDIPPIPPSAPPLRPIKFDDPLPTVATPFQLEDAAMAPDYFGTQHHSEAPLCAGHAPSGRGGRDLANNAVHVLPRRPSFKLKPYPRSVSDTGHAVVDWLIWLLVGSPPDPAIAGLDTSIAYVGGLLGGVIHLIAFTFFVTYHTSALVVACGVSLRATGVFLYWAALNLSGRTEVSRSVVDYWRTCRAEWDKVYTEEGETPIGALSVLRGTFELAVLQSMTREGWLRDGPGDLVLLNGAEGDLKRFATPRFGPVKRRFSRVNSKPSVTQRQRSFRWSSEADEEEGSGLVLTRAAGGILEGSIISHDAERPTSPPFPQSATSAESRRKSLVPDSPTRSIEQLLDDEPPDFDLDHGETGTTTPPGLPSSPPLLPLDTEEDPLEDFVALIKRYCRLCTASYGLHTLLPSPPTPLLTPSGQTLPHRVFAHLGGLGDHRNVLHVALQKRYDGTPTAEEDEIEAAYAPQFYILRDDYRGEIVCVIRGTQSLADVRTDLDGSLVPLHLPPLEGEAPAHAASYRVHSSILSAARHLLSPTSASPLHENLTRILMEHPRYALVFTGHSLGAALASTLALLLGTYDAAQRKWFVDASSSLGKGDPGRPLRAVCFAHPTTLNAPLAERCAVPKQALTREHLDGKASTRGTPLVINVSLGADVICRMGIPQVREIRRALGRLDRLRRATSSIKAESVETSEPDVVAAWWRWRKIVDRLAEGRKASTSTESFADSLERERSRLEDLAWRWRQQAEGWDRAGRAALPEEADVEMAIPAGHCFHLDQLPLMVAAEKRQEQVRARLDERNGFEGGGPADDEDDEEPMLGLYEVRNPTGFYAMPILSADLLGAHMPKAYLEATQSL